MCSNENYHNENLTLAAEVTDFSFLLCLSAFKLTFPCITVISALEGGAGKGRAGNPEAHICPLVSH